MKKIQIYDTTLRDGSQGEDISFSLEDKLHIVRSWTSWGWITLKAAARVEQQGHCFLPPGPGTEVEACQAGGLCSTRHPRHSVAHDRNLQALLEANTPVVTIFGKTWNLHVKVALGISLEENLDLIRESVEFLKSKGKEVIYDAEHFFDGFKADSSYALATLKVAEEAGADTSCLCDTTAAR